MPRDQIDKLLDELAQIRRARSALVQRIVDARVRGNSDLEAIDDLARLSSREKELTKVDSTELAAV